MGDGNAVPGLGIRHARKFLVASKWADRDRKPENRRHHSDIDLAAYREVAEPVFNENSANGLRRVWIQGSLSMKSWIDFLGRSGFTIPSLALYLQLNRSLDIHHPHSRCLR